MMNEPDDDLLWQYLDGELGAREYALVEKALAEHPDWRRRLDDLREKDHLLRAGVLEASLEERAQRIADRFFAAICEDEDDRPPGSLDEGPDRRGPGNEVLE